MKSSGDPDRRLVHKVGAYEFKNRVVYLLGVDRKIAEIVVSALGELPEITAHFTTPSWAGQELYDVHVTHQYGTKQHCSGAMALNWLASIRPSVWG